METQMAMQSVWHSTTKVWSLLCSGTLSGAHLMALVSHRCPALRPLVMPSSFFGFLVAFLSCASSFLSSTTGLTLMSSLFSSRFTFSNTVIWSLLSFTLAFLDFVGEPSVLSCDPLLLFEPDFRCLFRTGVLGLSSSPLNG